MMRDAQDAEKRRRRLARLGDANHIVFRCRKVRRVKDERGRGRGRREWADAVG